MNTNHPMATPPPSHAASDGASGGATETPSRWPIRPLLRITECMRMRNPPHLCSAGVPATAALASAMAWRYANLALLGLYCGLGGPPPPATQGYPPDSSTPGYSPDSDSSEPRCSWPRWIPIGGDMAFPGPCCGTASNPLLGLPQRSGYRGRDRFRVWVGVSGRVGIRVMARVNGRSRGRVGLVVWSRGIPPTYGPGVLSRFADFWVLPRCGFA